MTPTKRKKRKRGQQTIIKHEMTAYECPYFTGAEFVLILTDPARNESTCHLRVKVLQTYPFTKSQAMQVAILNVSQGYKGYLPPIAFLKLFDRRFLDDRAPLGDQPLGPRKGSEGQGNTSNNSTVACRAG